MYIPPEMNGELLKMPREGGDLLPDRMNDVFLMDEELGVNAAREIVEAGYDAYDAINSGLVAGMNRAGALYEKEEYFVPELLICSDAMYAGLEILRPHLRRSAADEKRRAPIGVVEGDTHDVGKNLVKIMMDAAGFEMHDLGRNVSLADFVEKAKEVEAELICLSTLMTITEVTAPLEGGYGKSILMEFKVTAIAVGDPYV
jgi:dimethylamine corrinoid protein